MKGDIGIESQRKFNSRVAQIRRNRRVSISEREMHQQKIKMVEDKTYSVKF